MGISWINNTAYTFLFERILAVPARSAPVEHFPSVVDSPLTSCENVGQTSGVIGVCQVFTVHINSVTIVTVAFVFFFAIDLNVSVSQVLVNITELGTLEVILETVFSVLTKSWDTVS